MLFSFAKISDVLRVLYDIWKYIVINCIMLYMLFADVSIKVLFFLSCLYSAWSSQKTSVRAIFHDYWISNIGTLFPILFLAYLLLLKKKKNYPFFFFYRPLVISFLNYLALRLCSIIFFPVVLFYFS